LYLKLFKEPLRSDDPEELTYQFQFREDDQPAPKDSTPQFWYLVGNVLDFENAEAFAPILNCKRASRYSHKNQRMAN
jgi:hypothetical protein